jgi:predicted AAA+ superfamily ATPase
MLGIKYKNNDGISIPMGFESEIMMFPLNFEEFILANGISENTIATLNECSEKILQKKFDFLNPKKEIDYLVHKKLLDLFNEYVVVGGMPEAVETFITTHNFNMVLFVQINLLKRYREDILKYAPANSKNIILKTFDIIPKTLAKQNNRFKFIEIENRKNGIKPYSTSIE